MKKIILTTILLLSPFIVGWTVHWDRPTYTDNTPITDDNVVYDAWANSTQIANGTYNLFAPFSAGRGDNVVLKVRARLTRQGTMSDNSTLVWQSPLGFPGNPLNLRVAQ